MIRFLAICVLVAAGAVMSSAQETGAPVPSPPSEEELAAIEGPGRLALWFDPLQKTVSRSAEAGEAVPVRLVAVGAEGGIHAWEARLLLDPRLELMGTELVEGIDLGAGDEVFRVGLGRNCRIGQEVILATITVRVPPEADDLVLGLVGCDPGTFHPPAPGYLTCLSIDDKRTFQTADTLAVINPVSVRLHQDTSPFRMERAGGDGR
jgi:hypothetical protein